MRLGRRLAERGAARAERVVQRLIGRAQQRTDELQHSLRSALTLRLGTAQKRMEALGRRLRDRDPRLRLAQSVHRARQLDARLMAAAAAAVRPPAERLALLSAQLETLSPLNVLTRGYAIVDGPSGILRDASAVSEGDALRIRLARGRLGARVESVDAGPSPKSDLL
jgi:exodeoxyribonuclease VII large subunit